MTKKVKPANGRRYSEADKAVAVQAVLASGGVVTTESWKQVQILLSAPTLSFGTLQLWTKAHVERKESPQSNDSRADSTSTVESVDFAHAATLQIVENTFRRFAERANDPTAVKATEAKDAARVMGDMVKLLQLLQGMPTEIVGWTGELVELANFFRENNIEGSAAIREWRERLAARKAAQEQVSNG